MAPPLPFPPAGARPWAAALRLWRSEEGATTIFSLFILILMLMMGGLAVDLMRHETARTRLQATLDRAILAATDLDQVREPRAVVEDYFEKAGLLDQLTSITVTETFNSRRVGATAELGLDTYFMRMSGIDQLVAPASGTAAESVNDIEIVLVLDVSGSMNSNNRLVNLRAAAREFVAAVLQNDAEGRISVSIVPFNGQVSLSAALADRYAISERVATYAPSLSYLNCVDLDPGVYAVQTIPRTTAMPATAHADTYSDTDRSSSTAYRHYSSSWNGSTYGQPGHANMWCPPTNGAQPSTSTAGNVVRLPSNSVATLQSQISSLVGVGATSINAGMRWGMTLLDPAARPMFDELIAAGHVAPGFAGRPYEYDRENTLKVIVLMTDGENFPEERVRRPFRDNVLSGIWRARDSSRYYSIFHPSRVNRSGSGTTLANNIAGSRPFWVPHANNGRGEWHARPWNGTTPSSSLTYVEGLNRRLDVNGDGSCTSADDGRGALATGQQCYTNVSEQTWPDVWMQLRLSWVAWHLYVRAGLLSDGRTTSVGSTGWTTQMNLMRTRTDEQGDTPTMDGQLAAMCRQARDRDVVVFGIAFEAPARGQEVIYDCASSPSHYFNAQGLQISTAFRAIASQINALRLVE
jgi:Flp pilus assembly protein TadG